MPINIIAENHYSHDAVGNRMSNQEALSTTGYTYDDIYRLTVAESNKMGSGLQNGVRLANLQTYVSL